MTDSYKPFEGGAINLTQVEENDPSARVRTVEMGDDGKPKVLTRQQINQCFMEVEDVHPFRRKHITDVIPPLRCF
jgi:hypothetical protein